MANLRRRSARLSSANANQSSARKTPVSKARLLSVVERDETPESVEQSIDGVLATPTTSRTVQDRLLELSAIKTPQTEPRPEQAEMNPKTAHRSTAKAPDSGLKLGFSDIKKDKTFDTPSKSTTHPSIPTATTFEFKFSSDSNLSKDAQKLMDNVREDAARIKAQMMAEKATQEEKEKEAEKTLGVGRKIAQPKGKVGRFSDIHMAQFKKMDSIENHASSFRAKSSFAVPTTQSLKRSPSKAELDDIERPRTAGRNTPSQTQRIPPPVTGRSNTVSPFKSIPVIEARSTLGPTKRARQSENQDVSDTRLTSAIPRPTSSLYSPTKSSLARTSHDNGSPGKPLTTARLNSFRPLKITDSIVDAVAPSAPKSTSKPLPPIPHEALQPLNQNVPQSPPKTLSAVPKESHFSSKLPTLSGLRSILRNSRKSALSERPATPKRPNTGGAGSSSPKKVEFTPSVKSRHAVKLAADSPSPAKIRRDTPYKASQPVIPYESSAYLIDDDGNEDWEDEDGGITYPTLPVIENQNQNNQTFEAQARNMNRRESKEFKSIFTNLHPSRTDEPVTLTSINTTVNKTNPETHANRIGRSPSTRNSKPSPSTIRHVRDSNVQQVQLFEDDISAVPHGLPNKKRRHESIHDNDMYGTDDDAKENRRISQTPAIPGGWDNKSDEIENEGISRGGKRARVSAMEDKPITSNSPVKKTNTAREAAAKSAKARKGRGVLSLSRLNMLSRPKSRT